MARKFACSVCKENCETDCIYCETCQSWLHYSCQNIDKADSLEWSNISLGYICIVCRSNDDGSFDYLMGSGRLQQIAKQGLKKLKTAVKRESLFMKSETVDNTLSTNFSDQTQDSVSNFILDHYHCNTKAGLQTTGDGDCLFNSVSILLAGNETRSMELRYRCCIEMINSRSKIMRHRMYPKLDLISPDYDKDCVDCAKPGTYSCVWRMMALSYALNLPIDSVYPSVNGSKHIAFQCLNTSFRPPFADPEKGRITILWTNTSLPDRNVFCDNKRNRKEWTPNHFVPLVDSPRQRTHQTEPLLDMETEPTTGITNFVSPNRYETLEIEDVEICDDNIIGNEEEHIQHTEKSENCHRSDASKRNNLSTIEEEIEHEHTPVSADISNETVENVENTDSENDNEHEDDIQIFTRGPLGDKFMDVQSTINLLQGPHTTLSEIPLGRKDGMYFIIENSSNIENRKLGKKSEVWDDCGAWKNASTPTSLFIQSNGKLTAVVKRNGIYCIEKQVNKKRDYIPVEPQPSHERVLAVHRLYQTLSASPKGKDQFKRRVTWLGNSPDFLPAISTTVAVVEYIGAFPSRQYHGCTKNKQGNELYVRTKSSVRNELKEKLKTGSVKDVEREMNKNERHEYEKQRNDTQLKNIQSQINRESRGPCESKNVAEQVICVEEMTKTHEFVKSVKHINGLQHPVVTLYTDQQIEDIRRFCCKDGGCVLNIDKTYNLGDFHVTLMAFKDLSVLRKSTLDHPISIGPAFIHTNSSTKTYSSFMHDIADNFTEEQLEKLVIGSDEEYALKSAIKRCFPGCTHVLCTRHMRDMFGYNGITESADIDTFNKRVENVQCKIDELDNNTSTGKKLRPYFDGKFLPLINEHVVKPAQNNKISPHWTNNNAESVNHILKAAIKWKSQEMPKFIGTLYDIVLNEQTERVRCIRGRGNYVLDSKFSHHLVDIDTWVNMSQETRDKREMKFLKDAGKSHPNVVVSNDGRRTVQKTPSAGKKPNQLKRKRAERSRTPAKRKLIC